MKRRKILKGLAAAGLVSTLSLSSLVSGKPQKPLNILFMGGTGFIGPHMVRAVVAQGHKVTLFNRGKSNPGLFSDLELIKGDRLSDDIKQVSGRRWDVIIDSSCYVPRAVNLLMAAVDREHLQHYLFISTISVYADFSKPGLTEDSPLATMEDPASEDVSAHYGALKVLCEKAAETAMPGKVMHVRCGVIIGPGDHTDRFTYWPQRVFHGGEMLAPGDGNQAFQTMDARDLANWIAYSVENNVVGVFNATNRAGAYDFAGVIDNCQQVLASDVEVSWVSNEFLLESDVKEMQDLPFWVAPGGMYAGIWSVNTERATAAGLKHRPLAESIRDTHAWIQAQPAERRDKLRAGWSAGKEAQVLAAWHASQSPG
jgi:2'-hydroxyisoflavone reductase